MPDTQLRRNFGNVEPHRRDLDDRSAGGDPKLRYLRKQDPNLFRYTSREVGLFGISAQVGERHDGDRVVTCRRWRRLDDELVDRKIGDGNCQHDDYNTIERSVIGGRRGSAEIDIGFFPDALRRPLEHPRQDHGRNEQHGEHGHDGPDRKFRNVV